MLSTAYALSVKSNASPTGGVITSQDKQAVSAIGVVTPEQKQAVNEIIFVFLRLLVIDIVTIIFAIHLVTKCSEVKRWPAYGPILLVLSMIMLPGIGTPIAIGVIIYYFASGCKSPQKLAFSFY